MPSITNHHDDATHMVLEPVAKPSPLTTHLLLLLIRCQNHFAALTNKILTQNQPRGAVHASQLFHLNKSKDLRPEPAIPFQIYRCDSHRMHAANPLRPPWNLLTQYFPPEAVTAINPAATVCNDDLRRQIWSVKVELSQVKSLETPPFCERLGSTDSSTSDACGGAAAATRMHEARRAGGRIATTKLR